MWAGCRDFGGGNNETYNNLEPEQVCYVLCAVSQCQIGTHIVRCLAVPAVSLQRTDCNMNCSVSRIVCSLSPYLCLCLHLVLSFFISLCLSLHLFPHSLCPSAWMCRETTTPATPLGSLRSTLSGKLSFAILDTFPKRRLCPLLWSLYCHSISREWQAIKPLVHQAVFIHHFGLLWGLIGSNWPEVISIYPPVENINCVSVWPSVVLKNM